MKSTDNPARVSGYAIAPARLDTILQSSTEAGGREGGRRGNDSVEGKRERDSARKKGEKG